MSTFVEKSQPAEKDSAPQFNEALRQKLIDLRKGPNRAEYSNNKMSTRLGCNTAYVSQYCNGNWGGGDLAAFERSLDDFFRNQARRKASGVDTIHTSEAAQMAGALELIRKTNDIGAIVAPSGTGKTRGEDLYLANNPTAIRTQIRSWNRDLNSIEGALFEAVGRAGYDNRTKRAEFLCNKMRGSDRLLIFADAHKLTKPALQWIFDFWEETLIPIALVGTTALYELLSADAQRFSRTGLWYEIAPEKPRELIKHMVTSLLPNANGEMETLCDLGEQIASHEGCYRAVHKQFKLAEEIKSGAKGNITYVQAVRSAHTKLIREWQLA